MYSGDDAPLFWIAYHHNRSEKKSTAAAAECMPTGFLEQDQVRRVGEKCEHKISVSVRRGCLLLLRSVYFDFVAAGITHERLSGLGGGVIGGVKCMEILLHIALAFVEESVRSFT